jgi:hypothetical protein
MTTCRSALSLFLKPWRMRTTTLYRNVPSRIFKNFMGARVKYIILPIAQKLMQPATGGQGLGAYRESAPMVA